PRQNVDLRFCPFDFSRDDGFESSDYLRQLRDAGRRFEVLVIDGQDWTFHARPVCFAAAQDFVQPGGIIVVDDSWRYRALRTQAPRAREVRVFEGVGPSRWGVTSTDVYFY
ncbi:MAG: hypothetical protein JO117_10885, partial [Verrucomicrobia bacterium]|nr:hypothetical protein [Verrucomicrobiota bacterium]